MTLRTPSTIGTSLVLLSGLLLASCTGGGDNVALVNGEPISRMEFDANMLQAKQSASAQGQNTEDAEVLANLQQQILDQLIATELVLQSATEAGISVGDEIVEQKYHEIVEQVGSEEVLAAQLSEAELTEADLRADIRQQLLIQGHINNQLVGLDTTVTNEEMQTAYAQIKAQYGEDVPPLSEIEDDLRLQLQEQKRQMAISAFLETLRDKAEIEILI